MNKIKFLKKKEIELNGIRYKPYTICNGTTKSGRNCKNKTKNVSKMCHLHKKD